METEVEEVFLFLLEICALKVSALDARYLQFRKR